MSINRRRLSGKRSGNHVFHFKMKKQYSFAVKKDKEIFNILIRNCYRPESFKKCMSSINYQNYNKSLIRVICCYDDDRCLEYLNNYKHFLNMEIFPVKSESKEKYKFNLYLNTLMDKVKDGWIIYLDDDDGFSSKDSLKILNNNITQINNIYFWKVKLGSNIVYPKNINNIVLGEISGIGFCFHSKYKNVSRWQPYKGGDFNFIKTLLKGVNLNRKFIDKVLTQNINNMIGFKGLKEEYYFEEYIKVSNIKQIYISSKIDNHNDILNNTKLSKYDNINEPAIFFGVFNNTDINKIRSHKGSISIIFQGKDVDNIKFVYSSYVKYLSLTDIISKKIMGHNYFPIKINSNYLKSLVRYKVAYIIEKNNEDHKRIKTINYYNLSFSKFSKNEIIYIDENDINNYKLFENVSVIIIPYSVVTKFSCFRGPNKKLMNFNEKMGKNLYKILIRQDEYYNINFTVNLINKFKPDHLLTVLDKDEDIEKIYKNAKIMPKIFKCLTGYVFETNNHRKKIKDRKTHIFYRGRKLHPMYGILGELKYQIGEYFKNICKKENLKCDISSLSSDRIYGNLWFEYLTNSKVTLATPSGSNVLNYNFKKLKDFNKKIGIPDLGLRIEEKEIFKNAWSYQNKFNYFKEELNLEVISPKMFEAIALGTVLVMYECNYNNIFKPDIHYIPLKKDHSNIDEVIKKMKDDDYLQKISDKAYNDIILSGKYNYKIFIEKFDNEVIFKN